MKLTLAIGLSGLIVSSLASALPSHFDWRERLGGISPVKNQGQCGDPYATTATAALETAIKIKEGLVVTLSEQQLLDCDSNQMGCNGGYFTAFDMAVNPGLALESDYPYEGTKKVCKKNVPVFRKATSWSYLGKDGMNPSVEEVKRAIYENGLVTVTVAVGEEIRNYTGGVINHCANDNPVNHMVSLVGWDDDGGYWIVRNSWGAVWGENGYFRIKYGCHHIAETAAVLKYDAPVAPGHR